MSHEISVVDFGVGNHASIANTLKQLKVKFKITDSANDIKNSNQIILPGVGSFPEAMNSLRKKKLITPLKQAAKNDKRIIGICLGMQLLTESSEEFGGENGLGLIPGRVKKFKNHGFHIGWNTLNWNFPEADFYIKKSASYYFNHSLIFFGSNKHIIASSQTTEVFATIIRNKKIIGLQFHPEKSQQDGQLLLKNTINGKFDA